MQGLFSLSPLFPLQQVCTALTFVLHHTAALGNQLRRMQAIIVICALFSGQSLLHHFNVLHVFLASSSAFLVPCGCFWAFSCWFIPEGGVPVSAGGAVHGPSFQSTSRGTPLSALEAAEAHILRGCRHSRWGPVGMSSPSCMPLGVPSPLLTLPQSTISGFVSFAL